MSDSLADGSDDGRPLAVLVIAGGRGRRLGGNDLGDKARVNVDGEPLLRRVLQSLRSSEVEPDSSMLGPVVVVGPPSLADLLDDTGSAIDGQRELLVQEQPAGAGPLAAVAAGCAVIDTDASPLVAIVGGDMPDVGRLLAALRNRIDPRAHEAAVVVDREGTWHYLAAVWRTERLRDRLAALEPVANRPLADLYRSARVATVGDDLGWSRDIDTAAELGHRGPAPEPGR